MRPSFALKISVLVLVTLLSSALSSCTINLNLVDQEKGLTPAEQDFISCDIWFNKEGPFPFAHISMEPKLEELQAQADTYRQNLDDIKGFTTPIARQVARIQETLLSRTLTRLETGEIVDFEPNNYPSASIGDCHRILGITK